METQLQQELSLTEDIAVYLDGSASPVSGLGDLPDKAKLLVKPRSAEEPPVEEPAASTQSDDLDSSSIDELAPGQRKLTLLFVANDMIPSGRKMECIVADLDDLVAQAAAKLQIPVDLEVFISKPTTDGATPVALTSLDSLDDAAIANATPAQITSLIARLGARLSGGSSSSDALLPPTQ